VDNVSARPSGEEQSERASYRLFFTGNPPWIPISGGVAPRV
jgi:hypothetical protein